MHYVQMNDIFFFFFFKKKSNQKQIDKGCDPNNLLAAATAVVTSVKWSGKNYINERVDASYAIDAKVKWKCMVCSRDAYRAYLLIGLQHIPFAIFSWGNNNNLFFISIPHWAYVCDGHTIFVVAFLFDAHSIQYTPRPRGFRRIEVKIIHIVFVNIVIYKKPPTVWNAFTQLTQIYKLLSSNVSDINVFFFLQKRIVQMVMLFGFAN